jgi:hypothetical protein
VVAAGADSTDAGVVEAVGDEKDAGMTGVVLTASGSARLEEDGEPEGAPPDGEKTPPSPATPLPPLKERDELVGVEPPGRRRTTEKGERGGRLADG